MTGPTGRAFVCETVSPKKLGTAIGLMWASSSLGNAVGSIIFSYVADRWSYATSFYLCSLILFGSGISALITLRKVNRPQRLGFESNLKIRSDPFLQSLKTLLRTKMILVTLPFAIASFIQLGLIRTFIPIYASQILNVSTFMAGLVQAVFNGFSVIFLPVCGIISDKVNRKCVIMTGFFICFASSVFYALTENIYQVLVTTIGVSFGFSLLGPSILAYLSTVTPKDMYGTIIGLYGSFENLGLLISPMIFAFVWNFNPVYIFHVCAATQAFGLALSRLLK